MHSALVVFAKCRLFFQRAFQAAEADCMSEAGAGGRGWGGCLQGGPWGRLSPCRWWPLPFAPSFVLDTTRRSFPLQEMLILALERLPTQGVLLVEQI